MKRCVSITCDFNLAIGKVNLNEIVYRLNEIVFFLVYKKKVWYDDLISERLAETRIPSKMGGMGLGMMLQSFSGAQDLQTGLSMAFWVVELALPAVLDILHC